MIDYKCPVCGNITYSSSTLLKVKCQSCGCEYETAPSSTPHQPANFVCRNVFESGPSGRSRGVAALLAILLGYLGIHYFYLGKNTAGIICLVLSIFSCGIAATLLSVMGIIQGILMFTMSEEAFEERYVYTESTFPF